MRFTHPTPRQGPVTALHPLASPPPSPCHSAETVSLSVEPSGGHSQGAQPLCQFISPPFPAPHHHLTPHIPKERAGRHLWKEQERQSQQNLDLEQPCRNGVPLLHSSLKNEHDDSDDVKNRVMDVTHFKCAGRMREMGSHWTRDRIRVANLAQLSIPHP